MTWKRVLCATDLSPGADEALRQADRAARAGAGELMLVHVLPTGTAGVPMTPAGVEQTMLDREQLASAVIERLLDGVRTLGRGPEEVSIAVEDGQPYAAIVRKAEEVEADLVVLGGIGSSGVSGLSRILLGRVAERVVRHAHASVLVARPPRAGGAVLVATDFSKPAQAALEVGAAEARARGVRLAALHAVEFVTAGLALGEGALVPPSTAEPQGLLGEMRTAARRNLDQVLATVGGGEAIVSEDPPGPAIGRLADTLPVDLAVVGTAGRTGLPRMLLGSTAETVVKEAPCSVLVVRRP